MLNSGGACLLSSLIFVAVGCGDDDGASTPNDAGADGSTRLDSAVDAATSDAAIDAAQPLPCDPGTTGCWVPLPMEGAPDARFFPQTVWTGEALIVWGGLSTIYLDEGGGGDTPDVGGIFRPDTNQWMPTSTSGLLGRDRPAMVWSGSEVLVFGGVNTAEEDVLGARLNPMTNTWSPMATESAPISRYGAAAVWTGTRMLLWGGATGNGRAPAAPVQTGGRYNPASNVWEPITTDGAPTARDSHAAVWTGASMIVWGGLAPSYTQTGGVYEPVADRWTPTSTTGAPSARAYPTAVWTGTEMIVWGGYEAGAKTITPFNTGGRYNPASDTWTPVTTTNAPAARTWHTAVWTGSRMIVWGGVIGIDGIVADGAMYDPATDTWTPMSTENAPSARALHGAVWTGSAMIVWGGRYVFGEVAAAGLATGAAFYPPQ